MEKEKKNKKNPFDRTVNEELEYCESFLSKEDRNACRSEIPDMVITEYNIFKKKAKNPEELKKLTHDASNSIRRIGDDIY